MKLVKVFNINHNIVQIYNNKNIKLFSKNFIDVTLKSEQNIEKSKNYDLIFKMAILDPKNCKMINLQIEH